MNKMKDLSALQCADRVEIFRQLAANDRNEVDIEIIDSVAGERYQAFLDFCDKVYKEKDKISSIFCKKDADKQVSFHIHYNK